MKHPSPITREGAAFHRGCHAVRGPNARIRLVSCRPAFSPPLYPTVSDASASGLPTHPSCRWLMNPSRIQRVRYTARHLPQARQAERPLFGYSLSMPPCCETGCLACGKQTALTENGHLTKLVNSWRPVRLACVLTRKARRIVGVAAMIAGQQTLEAGAELVGMHIGPPEPEALRAETRAPLKRRGLWCVKPIICDAQKGLGATTRRAFAVSRPRCSVHWTRNARADAAEA